MRDVAVEPTGLGQTSTRENDSPLTHAIMTLLDSNPVGLMEICDLVIEPIKSLTSAIEARFVSPSAFAFLCGRVSPLVLAGRPLEIEISSPSACASASLIESVARFMSAHARVEISIASPGRSHASHELPLEVRPSGSGNGWIARALLLPSSWTDATSVSVEVLLLSRRPLPSDCLSGNCLPATLRVGYNHAPAPAGAVFEASNSSDTLALQAALDVGGSTEETNGVR